MAFQAYANEVFASSAHMQHMCLMFVHGLLAISADGIDVVTSLSWAGTVLLNNTSACSYEKCSS